MAVKLKADIKTALDAAAADMTLALADTVAGIAVPFKDPRSPLRDPGKLFDVSDAGVVTVNVAKFDAMFDAAGTLTAPTQGVGSGTLKTKIIP
jgi:hypothetical protein